MPFNWRTPKRYVIVIGIHAFWLIGGADLVISTILAFSGICEIFGAFTMDINWNFVDLNSMIVSRQYKCTVDDRIKIANKFYDTVEFHAKAQELSIYHTVINIARIIHH